MIERVEFGPKALGHERRRKRGNIMLSALTETKGMPFSATFPQSTDAQAAYRFVESDHLSFDDVFGALADSSAALVREQAPRTILCIQDTTELLVRRLSARGFGTVGNPDCVGEFLHSAILVSTEGVPDGVLAARTWIRPPGERGKAKSRGSRAFEAKESFRWWKTMLEAEERLKKPSVLLHVADREGDNMDVMSRAAAARYRFLQRAMHDRNVEGSHGKLWATCQSWVSRGTRDVPIPAHKDEETGEWLPARIATVDLRFGAVSIKRRRQAQPPLDVNVVYLSESAPPPGVRAIDWLLLTNDPIDDTATAWQYVDFYRFRWVIEEFHKGLKTGCQVEERQYAERAHFDVALPLYMVAALRILRLTKLARTQPDVSAATELSPEETLILAEGDPTLASKLTLSDAVKKIARWGGHMGRRGDGPPGWITLWRGYSKLTERVQGYNVRFQLPS